MKTKFLSFCIFLISFIFCVAVFFLAKSAFSQVVSNGKAALLQGKIKFCDFYGPPNYGENPETDKIERCPILILDKEIKCSMNNEEFTIDEIQIIFSSKIKQNKIFDGARLKIKGEILPAQTGHHHTKFVLFASKIKTMPAKISDGAKRNCDRRRNNRSVQKREHGQKNLQQRA